MKKIFIIAIIGLFVACSGGYLRLHAKSLSTHITETSTETDPSGKVIGHVTLSQENTSETAALTDISMVLLYGGTSLIVVAIAALLFYPTRKTTYETPEV